MHHGWLALWTSRSHEAQPAAGERDDLKLDTINEVVQHIAARKVAQSALTV